MKTYKPYIFNQLGVTAVVVLLLLSFSCSKIFEEDLSDKTIIINMPIDKYVSSSSFMQFWWEGIDESTHYKIQIVKPNFDTIHKLLVDSNLTNNKFEWSFSPGEYEWRIQAHNSTSFSVFQTYSFKIDSSLDLTNSNVILISPQNNTYLNDILLKFKWLKEYNADYYIFSIYNSLNIPVVNNQKLYIQEIIIPGQEIKDTIQDGYYKWSVFAENSTSTSPTSTSYFTIDRSEPGLPILIKPSASIHQSSHQTTFQWVSGLDINYSFDSLKIYSDSNLITLKKAYRVSTNNISDSLSSGAYFWFVRTFDKAGNRSSISEIRKLTIN